MYANGVLWESIPRQLFQAVTAGQRECWSLFIQTYMSSSSLKGFEYYITFIDDFSRKTWIYFLKSKKSEKVLLRFQEFKALVENQTRKKIKVLRSDNGGEYTSHAFNEFCRQEFIRRQLTVPYTPHQNGVADRKNRAIVGVARAMLHD